MQATPFTFAVLHDGLLVMCVQKTLKTGKAPSHTVVGLSPEPSTVLHVLVWLYM